MYKLLETECERPRTLCPDYPEELEAIVLKALSKNVETRYQTADEFERDLEHFLTTQEKLITDRDITGLVAHTLGPRVRRRAEDLRNALEAADHPKRTVRPGVKFESPTPKTPNRLVANVLDLFETGTHGQFRAHQRKVRKCSRCLGKHQTTNTYVATVPSESRLVDRKRGSSTVSFWELV